MNSEALEIFRNNLLIQLAGASTMGLTAKTLRLGARLAGISVDGDDDVLAEVQYLIDKQFAASCVKAMSPENQRWRITADGRDYLATQGLL